MEQQKQKRHHINPKKVVKSILESLGIIYLPTKTAATIITHKTENKETYDPENTIGYEDIGIRYNFNVHTNNFVIIHVENKTLNDITALKEKITKCNDLGISVGIVLDTKADTLSEMYKDVDFLESIIKEYKIDLPIYCNIDHIMNNKSLNNAQRTALIDAFIDKSTRSNMYLGLYGTDTNLSDIAEYGIYDISSYDCFLVEDSPVRRYDKTCTIYKDTEGNIIATSDLSKIITEKGLNNANQLVLTAKYQVKEGDTFHRLSLRFGLSEEDLISYNNHKKELVPGEIINIPNLYQTINQETKEVRYSYAIARGIDISDYQVNLDWERIKTTSDYVIIELARDNRQSTENNGHFISISIDQTTSALEHNIDIGYYFCITEDMTPEVYKTRLESYLTTLDNELKSRNITLNRSCIPMFLDFEIYCDSNNYYELMTTFENVCNAHGFTKIGIYGNRSTLKSINSSLTKNGQSINLRDTTWYVWQAGGPQYSSRENTSHDDLTLSEIEEIKSSSYNEYTAVMQQVTNVCTDTGASNSMNHCDVSYLYEYEVFGDSLKEKLVGEDKEEENDLIGLVEVDLNKYPNVPINKILQVLDTSFTALYAILAISIVGKKLTLKLKRQTTGKHLTKKR